MKKNYYEILGVGKNATQEQIKQAYRNLSLKFYGYRWNNKSKTEKKQDEEMFKKVVRAYWFLSNFADNNIIQEENCLSPNFNYDVFLKNESEKIEKEWWNNLIKDNKGRIGINGIIEEIIPLENGNQAIVVNKIILYAVRLIEYSDTQRLFELIKSPRITFANGYSQKKAYEKVEEIRKLPNKELLKRKECQVYGLCKECQKPKISKDWCQRCNIKHLQDSGWESGNQKINKLIQEQQESASDQWKILEWIPYEQFEIEKDKDGGDKILGEGGFAKVYQARWINGPIKKWNVKKNNWEREGNEKIALKILKNSSETDKNLLDLLQEVTNCISVDSKEDILFFNQDTIVRCYGISRDPKSNNYVIVMKYMDGNTLSVNLQNQLSFRERIFQTYVGLNGLNSIHEKGLIHKDLHTNNILSYELNKWVKNLAKFVNKPITYGCLISDLGLCRPANSSGDEKKVFGVTPYVAPEILKWAMQENKADSSPPYTQASDIYAWAIAATETVSNSPPYHDTPYKDWHKDKKIEKELAIKIVREKFRPNLDNVVAPELWKELIKKCWNEDPNKRPTTKELKNISSEWFMEIATNIGREKFPWLDKIYRSLNKESWSETEYSGFWKQYKEAEEEWKNLDKKYEKITYSSKLINTKELARLFQQSQEQEDLKLELKKIEQEIKQSLDEETKELVSNFIQIQKKRLKDRKDKETRNKFKELKGKLIEKNLSSENIEKIMKYCERFIHAEQEIEEEKTEQNIEILPPASKNLW